MAAGPTLLIVLPGLIVGLADSLTRGELAISSGSIFVGLFLASRHWGRERVTLWGVAALLLAIGFLPLILVPELAAAWWPPLPCAFAAAWLVRRRGRRFAEVAVLACLAVLAGPFLALDSDGQLHGSEILVLLQGGSALLGCLLVVPGYWAARVRRTPAR